MQDTNRSQRLRLRFFGPPSLVEDGIRVPLALRPLHFVLLAMIVLGDPERRVSRKSIATELFPDDDETKAAANLRRHLSGLLSAHPAVNALVGRDRECLWHRPSAAVSCDVLEFEHGSLESYAGDFMDGVSHEWVSDQRERLRGLAVERFLRHAEARRADDDDAGALQSALRAIEIDPWNEPAAQLQIELLGERGDLPALEAAYQHLERRLREIDAKPDPQTVALVQRFHERARTAAAGVPRPLTSFVETPSFADVASLVLSHRLVTICGPGGAGKTRLSIEVAHKVAKSFPDGAHFVDLSAVAEADSLSDAVARALGVPANLAAKGDAGIHTMLHNRRALVVLDNCEQIAEASALFTNALLERAPHVHVLATTRVAFGLRGERRYVLEALSQADAMRLFLERARHSGWDGEDAGETQARVAAMCERLDRLPLALELAAGMLGTLPLDDLERQVAGDPTGIRSRDPSLPARHRSLEDVITWSVDLFEEREHEAFLRLAVFAGTFSAAAANAVCAVDAAMLSNLVAKSILVRVDDVDSRFTFLLSIGQYARRLLDADQRAAGLRDAHAAWLAVPAMRPREPNFHKSEPAWLRDIERDYANFAQALDWTLFSDGSSESGLRLAAGIGWYCLRRGFYRDGMAWVDAAIDRAVPGSLERAVLQVIASKMESRRANFEVARELAHAAVSTLESGGSDRDFGQALCQEARALLNLGRVAEAQALLERSLPCARRSGDPVLEGDFLALLAAALVRSQPDRSRELYVASIACYTEAGHVAAAADSINALAGADYAAERYDLANENLRRALMIHRQVGRQDRVAAVLSDLGDVALMQGSLTQARRHYAEVLSLLETSETRSTLRFVLAGVAGLALEDGRLQDAARLLGAAISRQTEFQSPAVLRVREHVRALVERALGKETATIEIGMGRALSVEEALRLGRSVAENPIHRRTREERRLRSRQR